MLLYNSDLPYVAISYDTATFRDLQFFISLFHNIELLRIEPDELFSNPQKNCQYINLIIKELDLRESVTKFLDNQQLNRFTFIHPAAITDGAIIGQGVFLYPVSVFYPGAIVFNDVIVHTCSGLAHNSKYGQGTVVSGNVTVTGNVNVGEFCFLGASITFHDNVTICDHVTIGAGAIIRKSIKEPGTYYVKSNLKKLRNINNTTSRSR